MTLLDSDDDGNPEERREEVRRTSDRHWMLAAVGALVMIASAGVAYGTAATQTQAALSQKVDRVEYVRDQDGQEAEIARNRDAIDQTHQALTRLQSSMDSANVRLREIVCFRQASSCR